MKTLVPMPQNFKKSIDWILRAYKDADVTFPNGFQKDAIQNAVGARKSRKWTNWSCDIFVRETVRGRFVIVEDCGTVGLTGENTPLAEVNEKMRRGEVLSPTERLSRFSSSFNSGGNTTGGGLYGAGKSVYAAASEEYAYYFDSLREDGKYVANVYDGGYMHSLASEGEEAEEFIINETGLPPKNTTGTRIIIKSPNQELVASIESGEIIPFIQESWWRIIQRLGSDSHISVNGTRVVVPQDITESSHSFELRSPETYMGNYKVKHFGFYVFQNGGNKWNGFSYYRKGMKIGEIELNDIPEKIKGKFWGYIEVDEAWETELANIEDSVHFGVSQGKRRTATYQNLKKYCNTKVRALLVDWGFIKDKESEDKKLRDKLQQIADDIQNLFDKLGFEDLGKGSQRADFDVRWQNIRYPTPNSERVTTGDQIEFTVRIKSSYITDKRFECRLYIENPQTGDVLHTICNQKFIIKANSVYTNDSSFIIDKTNSVQYAENKIKLVVKVLGSGKEKCKELSYFYDVDKPTIPRESISLVLHECVFPRQGERRINFGESLQNISYRIENKRNHIFNYRLNVSIHNASDPTSPKIVDVQSSTGAIKPFEEAFSQIIDKIEFSEEIYSQYLSAGVLELRARLIANEDDEEYEKGDKVAQYFYKIFLNCDEKNGKKDAFEIKGVDEPNNYRRSWHIPGTGRSIYINFGHAAYLNLQELPGIQTEYLREQMLKQFVLLYLSEGRYDMFNVNDSEFVELEPHEAVPRVIEKIESVYYSSLK